LLIFHTALQGIEYFITYAIPSLVLLGFWIYSFFYKPKSDVKLEVVNIRTTGNKAKIITFKKPIDYKVKPGNHINLHIKINDCIVNRSYSICEIKEDTISIGVKRQEGGLVSNYVNDNFAIGTLVNSSAAYGDFYNQDDVIGLNQINLFAGGSGITPFMSMLDVLPLDKVTLYYSNKSIPEAMFLDELKQKGINLKLYFTDSNKMNDKDIVANPESINYICGPESYMEFVKSVLNANNIQNIKTESFVIKKGEKLYKSTDTVEVEGKYVCIDCGYVKEFQKGEVFGYCELCNLGLDQAVDVWYKVI
jgi:ferredoxin-NADP reductase